MAGLSFFPGAPLALRGSPNTIPNGQEVVHHREFRPHRAGEQCRHLLLFLRVPLFRPPQEQETLLLQRPADLTPDEIVAETAQHKAQTSNKTYRSLHGLLTLVRTNERLGDV
jgi:hypothetical protein